MHDATPKTHLLGSFLELQSQKAPCECCCFVRRHVSLVVSASLLRQPPLSFTISHLSSRKPPSTLSLALKSEKNELGPPNWCIHTCSTCVLFWLLFWLKRFPARHQLRNQSGSNQAISDKKYCQQRERDRSSIISTGTYVHQQLYNILRMLSMQNSQP